MIGVKAKEWGSMRLGVSICVFSLTYSKQFQTEAYCS